MWAELIERTRNAVWVLRRTVQRDAFEREREQWVCGTVAESVCTMRDILRYYGFEIDHVLQFEDAGQVLSGRYILPGGERQLHIRFFPANYGLEVRAHIEYTPEFAPMRHVRSEDCESGCQAFWTIYEVAKTVMK